MSWTSHATCAASRRVSHGNFGIENNGKVESECDFVTILVVNKPKNYNSHTLPFLLRWWILLYFVKEGLKNDNCSYPSWVYIPCSSFLFLKILNLTLNQLKYPIKYEEKKVYQSKRAKPKSSHFPVSLV